MTGRPGCRTMEMNGGSSASYLARTPRVPLFCTLFPKGGSKRAFRLSGEGGMISIVRWKFRPVIFGGDCSSREGSQSWPKRVSENGKVLVFL